jgi:cobalt-precorrin-5B (C1)-methyltransferase
MSPQRGQGERRSGYTTGACAAAAAGAAVQALKNQIEVSHIEIRLPDGAPVIFAVRQCSFDSTRAECSVIKDAGDDPDITNGAEIKASVAWSRQPGIRILGGAGVGTVTKPGLEVAVGSPAINPVPQKMITAAAELAAGDELSSCGMDIIISVADGERLAKKTLNSRLGIVGGISILGTTGIVIPYSKDAYTACISQSLDVAEACGCSQVVLTTGRRSEKFAQSTLKLSEECYIQAGDYIGYSLQECAKRKYVKVTIWGMIGKISKLAAGNLYTNISDSLVDINWLAEIARKSSGPDCPLPEGQDITSANHYLHSIPQECRHGLVIELCRLASQKCRESVNGGFEVECIMSDFEGNILGRGCAGG